MSLSTNRPLLVSTHDHSSLVSIIAWVLIVTTASSVLIRLVTRFVISKKIEIDDVFIIIALIISIVNTISVSLEAINGLGRAMSFLNQRQLQRFQQLRYASGFLYAGSLCCTKISVVVLLRSLSPRTLHRKLSLAIGTLIFVWTAVSIFVIAFQCQIAEAWVIIGGKCSNEITFWTFYEAINIATDLALILLPLSMIWNLQAKKRRKMIFFASFAGRILVLIAAATRIIYLAKEASSGDDLTLRAWPATLCALIVGSLSIIAACVPYLKPFLDSLESGMMNNDQLRREEISHLYYGRSRSSKATAGSSSSHQPEKATLYASRTTECLHLRSFSQVNTDEHSGVFCGPALPSRDVRTAREVLMHA